MNSISRISCYSCPYSTIYKNERDKIIRCRLSDRNVKMKPSMMRPDWCELKNPRVKMNVDCMWM